MVTLRGGDDVVHDEDLRIGLSLVTSNIYIYNIDIYIPLDWMISGAKYSGVPHSVHVRSSTIFAKPKSVIFKCPVLCIFTLNK